MPQDASDGLIALFLFEGPAISAAPFRAYRFYATHDDDSRRRGRPLCFMNGFIADSDTEFTRCDYALRLHTAFLKPLLSLSLYGKSPTGR